jgi:hypothetical protein
MREEAEIERNELLKPGKCHDDAPAPVVPVLPDQVVSIPESAYKSRLGKLFVGRTEFLVFCNNDHAWGGLINPVDSGVNLYINSFTISNFTNTPLVGDVWFNSRLPENFQVSSNVSPENTALCPLPEPRARLLYSCHAEDKPICGVNPFLRITEPFSTLRAAQDGEQIIRPEAVILLPEAIDWAAASRWRSWFSAGGKKDL